MAFKIKKSKPKQKKNTFSIEGIPKPKPTDLFAIKEVKEIWIPHPYMITPKHLLPDRMYLDKSTIKEAEEKGARCGWKGCTLPFEEHKKQKTLFLQMKSDEKDLNKIKGLHEYLLKIKPILKQKKIDGIAFLPLPKGVEI